MRVRRIRHQYHCKEQQSIWFITAQVCLVPAMSCASLDVGCNTNFASEISPSARETGLLMEGIWVTWYVQTPCN